MLLSYRIPRVPSTPRIAVWRTLRRLGAAQVGDGLTALPADARTQEQLEWVAADIDEAGGSSTLWRAELTSDAQERAVVKEMTAARATEYVEIGSRAREAAQVTTSGVESMRVLRSLRRELRRVERRDYFPPAERDAARADVAYLARAVLDRQQDPVADSAEIGMEP